MRGIHMITSNTLTGILGTTKNHTIMLGLLWLVHHIFVFVLSLKVITMQLTMYDIGR